MTGGPQTMTTRRQDHHENEPSYAEAAIDACRRHGEPGALVLVNVTHAGACASLKTGDPWDCDCAPDIANLVQHRIGD